MRRPIFISLLAVALLGIAGSAHALIGLLGGAAGTAGNSAALTWAAPTTYEDGSPITGALTYNVYEGAGSSSGGTTTPPAFSAMTKIASGVAALTYSATGQPNGSTDCYAVTAISNAVEGGPSNIACKSFPGGG